MATSAPVRGLKLTLPQHWSLVTQHKEVTGRQAKPGGVLGTVLLSHTCKRATSTWSSLTAPSPLVSLHSLRQPINHTLQYFLPREHPGHNSPIFEAPHHHGRCPALAPTSHPAIPCSIVLHKLFASTSSERETSACAVISPSKLLHEEYRYKRGLSTSAILSKIVSCPR